jgi:hypothetical protein
MYTLASLPPVQVIHGSSPLTPQIMTKSSPEQVTGIDAFALTVGHGTVPGAMTCRESRVGEGYAFQYASNTLSAN